MPTPQEPNHGAVPTSSSRDGHANKRMFAIAAAVVAVVLLAIVYGVGLGVAA